MSEDEQPIEEVLRGLAIARLPESWMPVGAICIVKCLNPDGKPLWAMRMTDGINPEELLGTMAIQTALLKKDMLDDWSSE